MKVLALIGVILLGAIAFFGYQQNAAAEAARKEHARKAAAYLDCMQGAKYPDLCIAPGVE